MPSTQAVLSSRPQPLAGEHPPEVATIKRWRKDMRQALVQQRLSVADEDYLRWSAAIDEHLAHALRDVDTLTIGFCWPFQREHDARQLMLKLLARGATCALPVVVAPKTPLIFRQWREDTPMAADVYDIPVPVGTDEVAPDIVLAPLNGFDRQGFRLGYGAGYFDRTLAAMKKSPIAIGVGFELARLHSIYPQPHDIAMDFIVTELGIYRTRAGRWQNADPANIRRHFVPETELTI